MSYRKLCLRRLWQVQHRKVTWSWAHFTPTLPTSLCYLQWILGLGTESSVWSHSPRQLNALGSWHVPRLGRLPALWCSTAHRGWLQSMWRREGVEEPLIWLPTSKVLTRSEGYVTAVIEASVGGCNCRKGKGSSQAGLGFTKWKPERHLLQWELCCGSDTSIKAKLSMRRATGMA